MFHFGLSEKVFKIPLTRCIVWADLAMPFDILAQIKTSYIYSCFHSLEISPGDDMMNWCTATLSVAGDMIPAQKITQNQTVTLTATVLRT